MTRLYRLELKYVHLKPKITKIESSTRLHSYKTQVYTNGIYKINLRIYTPKPVSFFTETKLNYVFKKSVYFWL